MQLKIHKTPMGEVVALCDAELLGRKLSDGALCLDLEKHAGFYSGKKVGEKEAAAALFGAQSVNLVGKRSLAAASKAGMDTSGAILIEGVPHLQIYRLP